MFLRLFKPSTASEPSAQADCPWEVDFPVRADRQAEFQECVAKGRERMRGRRVVICGLARDLAGALPATIRRTERLGAMFADYRVVVYENDSADGTRQMLRAWSQANTRVSILSETRGDPINPQIRCLARASRMAYYRNCYRGFLAATFPDFEYAVVVDMDLEGGWSNDGVAHTFGCSGWDFVGSYGVQRRHRWLESAILQYDAWAFRPNGSYEALPTRQVNQITWRRGDPLERVYSCFGGLGVYRMEALLLCRYEGFDCEHVALHRNMREARMDRLFLNPSQLTYYGEKYGRLRRTLRRAA